jgi:hypothetical protein
MANEIMSIERSETPIMPPIGSLVMGFFRVGDRLTYADAGKDRVRPLVCSDREQQVAGYILIPEEGEDTIDLPPISANRDQITVTGVFNVPKQQVILHTEIHGQEIISDPRDVGAQEGLNVVALDLLNTSARTALRRHGVLNVRRSGLYAPHRTSPLNIHKPTLGKYFTGELRIAGKIFRNEKTYTRVPMDEFNYN